MGKTAHFYLGGVGDLWGPDVKDVKEKDVKLSHFPLVNEVKHGYSQCRQLDDGESRSATSSLSVWDEPPSLAHSDPHAAVLYNFRCCTGFFVQLLLHISSTLLCVLMICNSSKRRWREKATLLRLFQNTLATGPDGICLSWCLVASWCLDGDRYQKEPAALARATHFKENFLTPSFSCLSQVGDFKLQPRCLKLFLRFLSYQEAGAQKEWIRLFLIF